MARMAGLIRPLAVRARGGSARLDPLRPCAVTPLWKGGPRQGLASFGGFQRGFSSSSAQVDPYKTLGLEKSASEAEVKKAYRDKALKWHPDRNEDNKEKAQEKFAEASSAYEILKDSEKRREYDTYGRVGGAQNGHPGGHPGGFGQHVSQEEANRMFREAFGQQGQGMEQIFQQMFQQQNMQRQQMGGFGGPQRQQGVLQAGMEVQVRSDVAVIHSASRACGMDETNDERRARCAGKVGMITDVDPQDQSVKMRVMVTARGADEVWFGAGAVKLLEEEPQQRVNPGAGGPFAAGMGGFQQQQGFPGGGGGGCGGRRAAPKPEPKPEAVNGLHAGMEVQVQASAEAIHEASRACGIDADNDERRARCAGKIGTVIDIDSRDKSLKVRVMVKPGRADEVWFGARAVELLQEAPHAPEADAQASASAM